LVREKGPAPRTGDGHKEDAVAGKKQTHRRIDSPKILFLLIVVVIVIVVIIVIIIFGRAFTLVTTIFAAAFAKAY
jgi:t-SNARE complex subunit (syntaxin)